MSFSDFNLPSFPASLQLDLPTKSDQFKAAEVIVEKLLSAGFETYLAGGWVRDKVLGKACHDIDIATAAPLSIISRVLPKTIPIGAHFGCTIAVVDNWHFEVASFRKDGAYLDGRHPAFVEPGTARDDAARRDFTVNGLFFDIKTGRVLDFVGGLEDLKLRSLRCIGQPRQRFAEDKLRILRCARLAAKLEFTVDSETARAAVAMSDQVSACVSKERIWQELEKIAASQQRANGFANIFDLQLTDSLIPFWQKTGRSSLDCIAHLPDHAPLIYCLLALWSSGIEGNNKGVLKEKSEVLVSQATERFCLSRLNQRRLVLWLRFAELQASDFPPTRRADWCTLLADPHGPECFEARQALLDPRSARELERFADKISSHVQRQHLQKPLVTSAHLRALGIAPGKQMGQLLQLAQRLAVDEDLQSPEHVLARLPLPNRDE